MRLALLYKYNNTRSGSLRHSALGWFAINIYADASLSAGNFRRLAGTIDTPHRRAIRGRVPGDIEIDCLGGIRLKL